MLIGHSVGTWWHQQEPSLRRKSGHVLEEGMVLALEPHVNFWHVQDMVLVTKDAPLLLLPRFNTDTPFIAGHHGFGTHSTARNRARLKALL